MLPLFCSSFNTLQIIKELFDCLGQRNKARAKKPRIFKIQGSKAKRRLFVA